MKPNIPPVLIIFALVSFALVQNTQAVNPPPDGGYRGANTAEGQSALLSLTTGTYNTAIGIYSLLSDTTGRFNTGIGGATLLSNTADSNTATGAGALLSNITGGGNTANGAFALFKNTNGSGNIAIGYQAGFSLTTGNNNIDIGSIGIATESNTIRIGDQAIHAGIFVAGISAMSPAAPNQAVLVDSTTGQLGSADLSSFGVVITAPENTAVGDQALVSNTGESNTATGFQALFSNTDGNENTGTGAQALFANTTGTNNTALGGFALSGNVGGPNPGDGSFNNALGESALLSSIHSSGNTAIGDAALISNDIDGSGAAGANTAIGAEALSQNTDGNSNNAVGFLALGSNTTGNFNNAIGVIALGNNISGSGNVALGDSAGQNVTTASNVICIGTNVAGEDISNSCYIGNIVGETASGGSAVFITGSGKLGTSTSSQRFKDNIKPMGRASEAILALKPVTFHYKKELDADRIPQFGLVAEDVEKVNRDLVVRDKEGKPYSVRYEQVNAMLLNEFLKEHRKVEQLVKQIEALTAGLQKVSDQLEASKSAPQTVLNNH